MNKFNIGDEVVSIWEPDKVGTIKSIDTMSYPEPKYTVVYPDGDEYANYGACFKLIVSKDDVLKKGDVLTYDYFNENHPWDSNVYTEIYTIRYESRIFYVKIVDFAVVEFKELI